MPTAPAPSGLSAEIRPARTPNSATDFASRLEEEISMITRTNAAATANQKNICVFGKSEPR